MKKFFCIEDIDKNFLINLMANSSLIISSFNRFFIPIKLSIKILRDCVKEKKEYREIEFRRVEPSQINSFLFLIKMKLYWVQGWMKLFVAYIHHCSKSMSYYFFGISKPPPPPLYPFSKIKTYSLTVAI